MKQIFQIFLILFFSSSFLFAGESGDLPGEETNKPEEMFDEKPVEKEGLDVSNITELLKPKNTEVVLPKNRLEKIFNQFFLAELNRDQLNIIGESNKIEKNYYTGTTITFLPSSKTFNNINFNYKTIEKRLRELAFLNTGVKITLKDKRAAKEIETNFKYDGGINEYVKYLNDGKHVIHGDPIFFTSTN